MKTTSLKISLLIVATACAVTTLSQAATLRFAGQPNGSKIKVDGTSTVHDWSVHCEMVPGFIEIQLDGAPDLAGKTMPDLSALKTAPKVEINLPVRALKSDKADMDDKMHAAMKLQDFPKIEYRLKEWSLKEAPKTPGGPAQFNTKGELTVSGVKKMIEMPVTLEPLEKNRLKASGQINLKMTDFGIKPPAPAIGLGLIKTGDDVKVSFEWLTALRTEAK